MTDTTEQVDIDMLVNMDIAPQCEHSEHVGNAPASYLIRYLPLEGCVSCEETGTMLICSPDFDDVDVIYCDCGAEWLRDEAWKILAVL